MARMSQVCPRCWTPYREGAKRCQRCGFDLQEDRAISFIDLIGPPEVLRQRYEIQDTLAHSRTGHIYRALDLETRTACIIKELSGAVLLDPLEAEIAATRLKRRVRQLARLDHPNLVHIYDVLSEGSRHFVIMELIEGPSLQRVMKGRERPIPEPAVLRWAAQLCDALSYLHAQDPPLFFPDLAPRHVILRSELQPVLIDLGLTHLFEAHCRNDEDATGDIAALGALLYRLLTFAPRSSARSHSAQDRYPPIRRLNPDVSAPTAQAIMRAISRRSETRFASMAQFKEALLAHAHPSDLPATGEEIPTHVIPHIEPYRLTPEHEARSLRELVDIALSGGPEAWEAGVAHFFDGALTGWLREVADRLHEAGQESAAQRISTIARKGEELRQEAREKGDVQRQATFFQWLAHTGYAWGRPELAVSTTFLRLGAVRGELRLGAIFSIENKRTGFLAGEVRSQVEWLQVRGGEFGCRAGEATQITVELRGHSVLSYPVSSVQALHITSNGGEAWISASISAPRPMLTLDREMSTLRTVIDFGEVQGNEPLHTSAVVRNEGGGMLTGRISCTVPWLRVRPVTFHCPAGSTVPMDVELRPDLLPRGTTIQGDALIVDSDYGQGRIEVRATKVQPTLDVLSDAVDFGMVAPVYRVSQTLRVTNSGTGLLKGTVTSQMDWLTVEQADFQCHSKETALITLWADPTALPGGETEVPDALIIDSNGGYRPLAVRLIVRRPRLYVNRQLLDFGALLPGQKRTIPLTLSNQGVAPLHAELVPRMPWLSVKPAQLVCDGGQKAEAELTLHVPESAIGRALHAGQALYVASDGGIATLELRAQIISPKLVVDPLHLDFGLIGPTDVARAQLRLRNEGNGNLEWRLSGEFTWLEVLPRQGSCAPGEMQTIEVNAFALALPEGTTSAHEMLRIESNGGSLEIPISVAIAAPTLTVLPLLLDLGSSENYSPLKGTLRIANHGGGHLRGEVVPEVAWLRAEPSTFDCSAGTVEEIIISADPHGLPAGETLEIGALTVDSNGGREVVDVRLEVMLKPILEVSPRALVLTVRSTEERTPPETMCNSQELTLVNRGYGALRVRFQPSQEWLITDRGSATLRHGRPVRVRVNLDEATWGASEGGSEARLDIRMEDGTMVSIPVIVESS